MKPTEVSSAGDATMSLTDVLTPEPDDLTTTSLPDVLAEELAPTLVGITIRDRYTLWECIGAGLQAQAYLAYDNRLEGMVVVKVLSNEIEGIALPLPEHWEEEAKKAMRVRNCPYIASVMDFDCQQVTLPDGEVQELAYIVWEYVRGNTLEDFAQQGTDLTLDFLLEIAQQIVQVLKVLYKNDLVHGDLHSKNVMIDRESSGKPLIKVIDFGLSHQGSEGKGAARDLRCAYRMLTHLIDLRREALGQHRPSERDQEFAAIVAQFGVESSDDHGEVLTRLQNALDSLARRHMATTPAISAFESIDQLFPWSQTVLAQTYSFRAVPLIGRQELVQQLLGTLTCALQEGHGTVVLLKGESGIGKKRLAWETLSEFSLTHRDLFLLTVRGHRGAEKTPFLAIRQMLRGFLGEEREGDYARLLALLLPDSQPLIAPLVDFLAEESAAGGNAGLSPAALSNLAAKILAKISLVRPIVLWASDLQFVDEASRQCLLQIARDTARFPMMLLGSYAVADGDGLEGQALLDEWLTGLRGIGVLELPIRALPVAQTAQFLAAALPWPGLEAAHPLVAAMYQNSGGNPYLLQESLAYCQQSGTLIQEPDGAWEVDLKALQELGTSSIHLLLERKLQHLDPLLREVLDLAACWGSDFPEHDITLLMRGQSLETTAALFAAQEQGLLLAQRGQLSFQPYALWELLVQQLPTDRARRYHLRIAEHLQLTNEGLTNHEAALRIARHWQQAGDPQRALEYCQVAADKALSVRANETALNACNFALQLIAESSITSLDAARLTAMTHLQQAKAYRYIGDQAAQEQYAVRAYEGAIVARDRSLELRALKAMGEYHRTRSEYEDSTNYFRQGLDIAAELNDYGRCARFHKEIGVNYYYIGDMASAEQEYQAAIALNLELGDAEGLARVYNNLGMICRNRGEWAAAKDWFEKAIVHFQEAGETRGLVMPMGNMAIIYTIDGEYEKAMILLKELLKEESQIGEARLQAKLRVTLGDVQAEIGEEDDALENYEHSLTVYRALGDKQGECEVMTNIASMYFEQGKLDLAERHHMLGLELKREIGYEWGIPLDLYNLARIELSRREPARALEIIQQATEIAERLGMTELAFSLQVLEVRGRADLGRTGDNQLARHYDQLMEIYPDLRERITKQRQLMFLVQAGNFFMTGNEQVGLQLHDEARGLIKQLSRRLIRPERRARFWGKYRRMFPELALSERP